MIEMTTKTGPAAWAMALVNGDASGLNDAELVGVLEWLGTIDKDGWQVADVARRPDGEPEDARFTRHYRLHGGLAEGGDVIDYVLIRTREG